MDKILTRICSIKDHPISILDDCYREKYTRGLGASLFRLSNNSPIVRMYFEVWAKCIFDEPSKIKTMWRDDINAIKSAISIQRKGIKFFSMKYPFLFDIFYLAQCAQKKGYNSAVSDEIMAYFKQNICSMFNKGAMTKIHKMFQSGIPCQNVPISLLRHGEANGKRLQSKTKRVLVVANVSAGKSTLINSLVGYRLNKTKTTACTSKIAALYNKLSKDGITILDQNKNYFYYDNIESVNSDCFLNAAFPFNSKLSEYNICLIDTPGINNINDTEHRVITENAIRKGNYNAVIYVSNCQYFGTNDEHDILLMLKRYVKTPILFVLNQLDRFKQKEDSISKMLKEYAEDLLKIGFKSPKICPLSAQAALLFKLSNEQLDEDDREDKDNWNTKFGKDYYDLPTYVGIKKSKSALDRTGITYLERQLINI